MFKEKSRTSRPPLEGGDHPELDTSELCDDHQTKQFQTLIGQLQWLISLGHVDIAVHGMSLSRFRAQPRKGHLDRAKRIVGYLFSYLMVQSDLELGSLTSHPWKTKNMIGPEVSTLEPVSRSHITFPNL